MNSNIEFKAVREVDLPMLYDWFQLPHVKQWYARDENYTLDMIREKYLPRIQNADSIPNYIIYTDGHPVGYIQSYCLAHSLPDSVHDINHPLFDKYKPIEWVGVDLFVVDDGLLGTGFSSIMLNQFIDQFLYGKYRAIVVDPLKVNARVIRFFEKNRFKLYEHTSQGDHILLIRELSSDCYIHKGFIKD